MESNALPRLADEITSALSSLMQRHPDGPSVVAISKEIGADIASTRRAMIELNRASRANMMRRPNSREQFLVPIGFRKAVGLRYCANCDKPFALPSRKRSSTGTYYSNRRTCSRSCAVSLSWKKPGVSEQKKRSISRAHSSPKALNRLAAFNRRRWSKPGERERLAEQNRRAWADPVKAAIRTQAIREIRRRPEKRALASKIKKAQWATPQYREKTVAGIRRSKRTPESREKFSQLLKARWSTPEGRKIYLAGVRKTCAKMAKINKGKRQSKDQIAKRVRSRRETMESRP